MTVPSHQIKQDLIGDILDAALDQRRPSPQLQRSLQRYLVAVNHPARLK